jgi:hypothetical protein
MVALVERLEHVRAVGIERGRGHLAVANFVPIPPRATTGAVLATDRLNHMRYITDITG